MNVSDWTWMKSIIRSCSPISTGTFLYGITIWKSSAKTLSPSVNILEAMPTTIVVGWMGLFWQGTGVETFRFLSSIWETLMIWTKSTWQKWLKFMSDNKSLLSEKHLIKAIKHLKIKKPILYKTHKVIFCNASYKISIILILLLKWLKNKMAWCITKWG